MSGQVLPLTQMDQRIISIINNVDQKNKTHLTHEDVGEEKPQILPLERTELIETSPLLNGSLAEYLPIASKDNTQKIAQ